MNTQGTLAEQKANKTLLPFFHGIWGVAGFIGASVGTLFIKNGIPATTQFIIVASLGIATILLSKKYLIYKPELEKVGKHLPYPKSHSLYLE